VFSAVEQAPAAPAPRRRRASRATAAAAEEPSQTDAAEAPAGPGDAEPAADQRPDEPPVDLRTDEPAVLPAAAAVPLFQPPVPVDEPDLSDDGDAIVLEPVDPVDLSEDEDDEESEESAGPRRRRRRGGRRRRKTGGDAEAVVDGDAGEGAAAASTTVDDETPPAAAPEQAAAADDAEPSGSSSRRRRRRRKGGEPVEASDDDPDNTVTRVRERKRAESEITSVEGSTRLEAKKQRRREGREAGRRRPPVLSESEFLARREAVTREMVVRQRGDLTQIAVLEDSVLVEHYVARESQASMIGNVHLGRVQNVLPSMEAAFIDIGKGRNAVLYAGEVDWKALGMDGKPRRIEEALSAGQQVLVQVTKDPVGQKGARLTGQISLPGRFVVYVPNGHTSGISRKLPEGERSRLKGLLKSILPDESGVIIRTAAEGATEDQLSRDVGALTARWADITAKAKGKNQGPTLLYGEPDLLIKVVRDLFTEDFASLVIQGDEAWDSIQAYVGHVAPDLADRLHRYVGDGDCFGVYRVDEQIQKALDRKVFLPSGGSLVIDRTEAMTVVDVNTGKFIGSGGNLESTVTKNNLEAAEEIVRQLRLRDIGGMIVVDFIDMVLESNRDLVLRRLIECLSRDRTRHQVAEVTSLGLVQMTRKKIGTGLVEVFSQPCEHCEGRGLVVQSELVEPPSSNGDDSSDRGGRRRPARPVAPVMPAPALTTVESLPTEVAASSTGTDDADSATDQATDQATVPEVGPDAEQDPQPEPDAHLEPGPQPELEPQSQPVVEVTAPSTEPREAITPRKRAPRKRVTRSAAPPAPTPDAVVSVDAGADS
jgi:ribonuclease E